METAINVRNARLDDTHTISLLFRQRIAVWQRITTQGGVESPPYEALTLYERWLHGGAWMSVETAAIFLNHLLRGAGMALVAVSGDEILGYAEAYIGQEPAPYQRHVHLARLVLAEGVHDPQAVKDALVERLIGLAREQKCRQLTVAFSSYDEEALAYYRRFAMKRLNRVVRYTLHAQPGQTFYKATPHQETRYAAIEGWGMPVGRTESARWHWETVWPDLYVLPEMQTQKTHRLLMDAAGQKALVCCQQQLYDVRSADIYCWSQQVLTPQLLAAIRDWSHRQGYRTLVFAVPETTVKALGAEAENTPYQQDIYGVEIEA
ncbi:MAG: hypothetical protein OHK0046_32100 [Anaerolineae bacterium]